MSDIQVTTGWTMETLKLHIDRQLEQLQQQLDERATRQDEQAKATFAAAEKATDRAVVSAKEAVDKQEIATEKRFASVNEFRGQLADQAQTFLPRAEFDVAHRGLGDKLEALDKRLTTTMNNIISRLDVTIGKESQQGTSRLDSRADSIRLISIISVIVTILIAVTTITVIVTGR